MLLLVKRSSGNFYVKDFFFTFFLLLLPVPPDPPRVFDPVGNEVTKLLGPYDEGESVSFTCSSDTGKIVGRRKKIASF